MQPQPLLLMRPPHPQIQQQPWQQFQQFQPMQQSWVQQQHHLLPQQQPPWQRQQQQQHPRQQLPLGRPAWQDVRDRRHQKEIELKAKFKAARQLFIGSFAQKLDEPVAAGSAETLRMRFKAATSRQQLADLIAEVYGPQACAPLNEGNQTFVSHLPTILDAVAAANAEVRDLWDAFRAAFPGKRKRAGGGSLATGGADGAGEAAGTVGVAAQQEAVGAKRARHQARQHIIETFCAKLDAPASVGSAETLRARVDMAGCRQQLSEVVLQAYGGLTDSPLTTSGQSLVSHIDVIMEAAAQKDEGLRRRWAEICRAGKPGTEAKMDPRRETELKAKFKAARQLFIGSFAQKLDEPVAAGSVETLRMRFKAATSRQQLADVIAEVYGPQACAPL
eukprot:SAG11_NODE_4073_length_2078_cov_4.146539_2_plen_389_part_01